MRSQPAVSSTSPKRPRGAPRRWFNRRPRSARPSRRLDCKRDPVARRSRGRLSPRRRWSHRELGGCPPGHRTRARSPARVQRPLRHPDEPPGPLRGSRHLQGQAAHQRPQTELHRPRQKGRRPHRRSRAGRRCCRRSLRWRSLLRCFHPGLTGFRYCSRCRRLLQMRPLRHWGAGREMESLRPWGQRMRIRNRSPQAGPAEGRTRAAMVWVGRMRSSRGALGRLQARCQLRRSHSHTKMACCRDFRRAWAWFSAQHGTFEPP